MYPKNITATNVALNLPAVNSVEAFSLVDHMTLFGAKFKCVIERLKDETIRRRF